MVAASVDNKIRPNYSYCVNAATYSCMDVVACRASHVDIQCPRSYDSAYSRNRWSGYAPRRSWRVSKQNLPRRCWAWGWLNRDSHAIDGQQALTETLFTVCTGTCVSLSLKFAVGSVWRCPIAWQVAWLMLHRSQRPYKVLCGYSLFE